MLIPDGKMGDYRQKREENRKKSVAAGLVAAVSFHAFLFLLLFLAGIKYIGPAPEESGIEISFEEEEVENEPEETIEISAGPAPESPAADPEEDIRLAKASQAPYEGEKPNVAEEAVNDDFGDVETPEPREEEKKKEIDKRALFPSAANMEAKDTLAAQTAAFVSEALSEGHPLGNTTEGENEEGPNARLEGREVIQASLSMPEYGVQIDGKIIIDIWVDQYGNVKNAVPGDGCTITSKELWDAAVKAAYKAKFNRSSNAPVLQRGTITYIYKLK